MMLIIVIQDGKKVTELCDLGRQAVRNKAGRESRYCDNG